MALIDWQDTRDLILMYLNQRTSLTREKMAELVLKPGETETDLKSLLHDMETVDKSIHRQYSNYHLNKGIPPKKKKGTEEEANPWVWYAHLTDSGDFRQELKAAFTKEDGQIFKYLGALLTNTNFPRIGTRVAGPITEEEGRYIYKINDALQAYLKVRKDI